MSENRLSNASSAYLRSAAQQPVHWQAWADDAFERARREDKPILLDVGAVWCHWCHVIDHESYDDPDVAKIINEHFVAIKVDRDERPDIDARYQHAVSAISGQGGWPLTAFLTPEGKVFFGGTYFPPVDSYGRPGFKRVLLNAASYYRENRDEVAATADQLHRQLRALAGAGAPGEFGPDLPATGLAGILRAFDDAHGGFGGAPKFPHPSTIEFLLRRHFRTRDEGLLAAVTRTLEKIGRGGIHDQVGGGFHRYATDARWIVPHFEKMLYDNAGLLANFCHAYQATGQAYFREVAIDTAQFMRTVLYDDARGGFYGSQDADVQPGDDGSYFTWTEAEARAALAPDEAAVLAEHYHLHGRGEMHGEPGRHVLFVDRDPDVIAAILHMDVADVRRLVASGREQLLASRAARPAPYVDTALYANWNGMAICAFLDAYEAFGDDQYRDAALRALDRFLHTGYDPQRGFVHVLPALDPTGPRLLDDQVQMAQALLDAYETTSDERYLRIARDTMDLALRDYWDTDGFLDVPKGSTGPALETPYKPLQDAPTPAPNAVAALVLTRLSRLLEAPAYRSVAERLLRAHAPALAPHGLFASTVLVALDDLLHEPAHVTIVGSGTDSRTAALRGAALRTYRPDKIVSLHSPADGSPDDRAAVLPAVVRAMVRGSAAPTAYVCAGAACAQPTGDPEALAQTIMTFGIS
jgi:uncharacterized protein